MVQHESADVRNKMLVLIMMLLLLTILLMMMAGLPLSLMQVHLTPGSVPCSGTRMFLSDAVADTSW